MHGDISSRKPVLTTFTYAINLPQLLRISLRKGQGAMRNAHRHAMKSKSSLALEKPMSSHNANPNHSVQSLPECVPRCVMNFFFFKKIFSPFFEIDYHLNSPFTPCSGSWVFVAAGFASSRNPRFLNSSLAIKFLRHRNRQSARDARKTNHDEGPPFTRTYLSMRQAR